MMRPLRDADPVDLHIGEMLKRTRTARGLTGIELAQAIGISNQVLSLYENGHAGITLPRLWSAAQVLGVPIETFFPVQRGQEPRDESILPVNPRFAEVSQLSLEDQRRVLGLMRRLLDLPDHDDPV